MKLNIITLLKRIAGDLNIPDMTIRLDYPENLEHGDFTTNIALVNAKTLKMNPHALAEKIVAAFKETMPEDVTDVGIAGPGFINFKLKDQAFAHEILKVAHDSKYGIIKTSAKTPEKVMVEYTDPNPFKAFHIGHLMSNAIGESISRLIEYSGAKVIRANWQGDVGLHVAKALWGKLNAMSKADDKLSASDYWGAAYARGAEAYDSDDNAKQEIETINKKIYDRSDAKLNDIYDKGRKECLDAFEEVYKLLGTKFDNYFFEGKEGRNGEVIVREQLKKGVFEESQGAIIFPGEKYGLHTRVFITKQGLPTYEAKEFGLNTEKFKLYPDLSRSIIVTGNEINDYFKVLLKALSLVEPHVAERTTHIGHGMLRFASGKMSSRTGKVITAASLIGEIKDLVMTKVADRKFDAGQAEEISNIIAVGAIKYSILRSAIGSDIIYDQMSSISFEGDSGPYLQYATVRACSILVKAEEEGVKLSSEDSKKIPDKTGELERLIIRFPDILERARNEFAPQVVAGYLISLASVFNSFYASQIIVDPKDSFSPYYVALTKAFVTTMTNGLWVLGIRVPEKM